MTEFDQLIKDKANQAHYDYKPSAWRRYCRKAGIHTGFGTASIVCITIVAAALVGGIIWEVISLKNKPDMPETAVSYPVTDTTNANFLTDTTTLTTSIETELEANEGSTETENSSLTQRAKAKVTIAQQTDTTNILQDSTKIVKPTNDKRIVRHKVKQQESIGRIIHINPDTIKDNVPTDEELKKGHSNIISQ